MATLPRTSKLPPASSSSLFQDRPHSISTGNLDFDAGINASNAWMSGETASLHSQEEEDSSPFDFTNSAPGRPARALYDFEGKVEFRELSVEAGDELEVLEETLPDGWSLVKTEDGQVGLLPQTYYTFTSDFTSAPDVDPSSSKFRSQRRREPSEQSDTTPKGSPTRRTQDLPIVPQYTGEWFPSFRHSLLKGKSFNRFSTFVTSGAEEWVLKGSPVPALPFASGHDRVESSASIDGDDGTSNRMSMLGSNGEADRHFIEAGPSWKAKIPPFKILVHSPSKRTSTLSGGFTMYCVTSLFTPEESQSHYREGSEEQEEQEELERPASPMRISVYRRFSHFVFLHTALSRRLPGIALPPLPEKQYSGRFSEDFIEARRNDLQRYLEKLVRHPVARYAEVVTFFLGCESDSDWKRLVPQHLSVPPAGPTFYAHVFHPEFNLDAEDAEDAVDRFSTHIKAVGKSVQALRSVFARVREARLEMSKAERLLSYSLLSLIVSKPLQSTAAPATGVTEEDEQVATGAKGLMNSDGAWCWREGCQECLNLTKAIQRTSEVLQNVADLYDDHGRRRQLATHESFKGMAHPSSLYEGVISTHHSALSRYNESSKQGAHENDDIANRCETVLNTTMAEMEIYHTQKEEDFSTMTKEHLDGEIEFYEQVLQRLRAARQSFDDPTYSELSSSPRQPSMYERDLENPSKRLNPPILTQPAPHVFDSAPMRPVSVAIQEGVGLLTGRGSVFGKFW